MFENLSERLERSFKILKGEGSITEINVAETLKDVRRALLDADVNYKVAKSFTDKVKQKLPELPSPETMLYADADGELFEDDPRQGKLFDQAKAAKPTAIEHGNTDDAPEVVEPQFRRAY